MLTNHMVYFLTRHSHWYMHVYLALENTKQSEMNDMAQDIDGKSNLHLPKMSSVLVEDHKCL